MSVVGTAARRPFTLIPALAADAEFFWGAGGTLALSLQRRKPERFSPLGIPFPFEDQRGHPPQPPFLRGQPLSPALSPLGEREHETLWALLTETELSLDLLCLGSLRFARPLLGSLRFALPFVWARFASLFPLSGLASLRFDVAVELTLDCPCQPAKLRSAPPCDEGSRSFSSSGRCYHFRPLLRNHCGCLRRPFAPPSDLAALSRPFRATASTISPPPSTSPTSSFYHPPSPEASAPPFRRRRYSYQPWLDAD
jgi:hypothetical protein